MAMSMDDFRNVQAAAPNAMMGLGCDCPQSLLPGTVSTGMDGLGLRGMGQTRWGMGYMGALGPKAAAVAAKIKPVPPMMVLVRPGGALSQRVEKGKQTLQKPMGVRGFSGLGHFGSLAYGDPMLDLGAGGIGRLGSLGGSASQALYMAAWEDAKKRVAAGITPAQPKLDQINAKLTAFVNQLDALRTSAGTSGSPAVSDALGQAEAAFAALQTDVSTLQSAIDDVNAKSLFVKDAESSGNISPNSPAQQALDSAKKTVAGFGALVDAIASKSESLKSVINNSTVVVNREGQGLLMQAQQLDAQDAAMAQAGKMAEAQQAATIQQQQQAAAAKLKQDLEAQAAANALAAAQAQQQAQAQAQQQQLDYQRQQTQASMVQSQAAPQTPYQQSFYAPSPMQQQQVPQQSFQPTPQNYWQQPIQGPQYPVAPVAPGFDSGAFANMPGTPSFWSDPVASVDEVGPGYDSSSGGNEMFGFGGLGGLMGGLGASAASRIEEARAKIRSAQASAQQTVSAAAAKTAAASAASKPGASAPWSTQKKIAVVGVVGGGAYLARKPIAKLFKRLFGGKKSR